MCIFAREMKRNLLNNGYCLNEYRSRKRQVNTFGIKHMCILTQRKSNRTCWNQDAVFQTLTLTTKEITSSQTFISIAFFIPVSASWQAFINLCTLFTVIEMRLLLVLCCNRQLNSQFMIVSSTSGSVLSEHNINLSV